MATLTFEISSEIPADRPEIEALLDACFGLGRRTKTSYRFREGETPIPGLSFVARDADGRLVGAISFWRLMIGEAGLPAVLLGPLAVAPDLQGKGIGRALMGRGIAATKTRGHRLIILVGDEPYYGRVGFRQAPEGQFILPGPVDPNRLLYLELAPGALAAARGLVLPPSRFTALRGTTSTRPAPRAEPGSGAFRTTESLQSL